ncbi:MAG: PD40 domain-containing protein [Bryobacterales bacterium]|nr:PD40 domain-containing protein [Bryobacterales bacterium]
MGRGTPQRLTSEERGAGWPSWSPDGQSIALFRGLGEGVTALVRGREAADGADAGAQGPSVSGSLAG